MSHARLIVQISVKGRSPQRLRGAVERLALIQTEKVAQPLDIPSRPLDETTRQHTPWSVELLVLPGAFRGVELGLIIEAIGDRDNERRVELLAGCAGELLAGITTLLDLVIDLDRLTRSTQKSALTARSRCLGLETTGRVEAGAPLSLVLEPTGRLGAPTTLHLPAGALPDGAEVSLRRLPTDDMEASARFNALGPPFSINSTSGLRAPALLTLPLDLALMRARRLALGRLSVLHWDGETRREMSPHRIDLKRGTITVRVPRLSNFAPCIASLIFSEPEIVQNAIGEMVAYANDDRIIVAGTTQDPQAVVAVAGAQAGWSRLGFFAFTGVPIGKFDTLLSVTVTAADGSQTMCELPVRRCLPRKWVDAVHRFYGPSIAFGAPPPHSSESTPFASATTIQSSRLSQDDVFPNIADIQNGLVRTQARLYRYDVDADAWTSGERALVPESFFENEAARAVIERLNLPVPVDPGVDPSIRFLSAANDLLGPQGDGDAAAWFRVLFPFFYRDFSHRRHVLSLTVPLAEWKPADGGAARVGAAWVAATVEGIAAANTSGIRNLTTPLYEGPFAPSPDPVGLAGALFFRACGADGQFTPPERVDEAIWCGPVTLRIAPTSARPTILALAVRPDSEAGDPVCAARIYQRGDDGAWRGETVLEGVAILDAHFTLDPGSDQPWVIVSVADPNLAPPDPSWSSLDGHLRVLRRTQPLSRQGVWEDRRAPIWVRDPYYSSDMGMWPRIESDGAGRHFVAFAYDTLGGGAPVDPNTGGGLPAVPPPRDQAVTWFVGSLEAADGAEWQVAVVGSINYYDHFGEIDGVAHPLINLNYAQGLTAQSRVSYAHWAPSIVVNQQENGKPTDAIWYAYGAGVLHLAKVDVNSGSGPSVMNTVCDVDRMTGFFPALTVRDAGAPLVIYKDPFGAAMFDRFDEDPNWVCGGGRCNPDELQFFALDQGTQVPPPAIAPPLAPGRQAGSVDLVSAPTEAAPLDHDGLPIADADVPFGARQPFTCEALQRWQQIALVGGTLGGADIGTTRRKLNPMLASILTNATIDFTILTGHNDRPLPQALDLGNRSKESFLAALLSGLRESRPDITIVSINNDVAGENLKAVVLAMFGEAFHIDDGDGQMRMALGRGQLPAALQQQFVMSGLALSQGPVAPIVNIIAAGAHWQIADTRPELAGRSPNTVTYEVTLDGITLRVAPTPVVRGVPNTAAPTSPNCNLANVIDTFAPFLAQVFGDVAPPLPTELAQHARLFTGHGLSISANPVDWRGVIQQGGMRFAVTIPQLEISGDDPVHFLVRQTSPSTLYFELAPMVVEHGLNWYIRDSGSELGSFDAHADAPWWARGIVGVIIAIVFGPADLLVLAVAEIGGQVALDAALDWGARKVVSSSERPVDVPAGLSGLATALIADYANVKFGGVVPPLEAVFMRIEHLEYWQDVDREHHPSDAQGPLTALPQQLFFEATVNDTPAVRNILIANGQNLPAVLESIAPHIAGGEFSVVPPSGAPAILAPGTSVIVKVQFAPQPPPGLRMSSFDVTFNGGSVISIPVNGLAQQGGQISVIPADALRFGIVDVGAARALRVELRNIGASALHITGLRTEGVAAATFGVAQATPITIAVATSAFLDVAYTPAAMTSGGDRASLVIESDDLANPVYRLGLIGFGILATMVVQPLAWNFPDTPAGGPTQRRPVSIYATGPVDLNISGASFQVRDQTGGASPDFRVLDRNGVPLPLADVSIRSGSGFTILIEFAPTTPGQHDGTLRVIPLNANLQQVPIAITARAV